MVRRGALDRPTATMVNSSHFSCSSPTPASVYGFRMPATTVLAWRRQPTHIVIELGSRDNLALKPAELACNQLDLVGELRQGESRGAG